jgi:ParB-like chromosome segregation protein Spo0J
VDQSIINSMKESILKEGSDAVPPITVRIHNEEALVVQGHHRLEAFRQLGYDRVPIKYVHKSQLGKIQNDGDYFRTLEELLAGKIDN